jgi:hypothetical protein
MKRSLLIFLTLFLFSTLSQAQVYLRAYTGYSVSANPEKLQSTEIVNGVKNVYQSKYKWGEGMNLGFAVGFRYNKNLSFEVTSNTQVLNKKKIFIPQKDLTTSNNWMISGYFGNIEYTNTVFQFAPQIVYTVDYNQKMLFYPKTGPQFLLAKSNFQRNYLEYSLDSSWSWHTHQIDESFIEKGGINIELQSSVGIEYKFSKNVHFTCEFISVICNYKPQTSETIKYKIDGADRLNDLNFRTQKNTQGIKTDFSSWGINVGIKYLLKRG